MQTKTSEFLTRLIILCSLVMLAFTGVIGINTSKYCLYFIVASCIAKMCFLRIRTGQLIATVLILLSCLATIVMQGVNPANHLIFFTSVMLAVMWHRYGIDCNSWKLLKISSVMASVLFVMLYLFGFGFDEMDRLILFFDNPNMTGIALCAPTMVLLIMFVEEKRTTIRGLYAALAAAMVFLVYRTENRGSFFTLLVFVAFVLLAMIKKKSIRMTSKTVFAVLKLMPIIVMLLYVFLYTVLPKDLELLGKPFFSGREYAWKLAIEQLIHNPFGQNRFDNGTLNLFLEGVRRYGIFSMIGYFWILFSMSKTDLKTAAPRSYLAYLGFHLYLFQQSFESTLITGSYSVYVWTYVLLGIASMHEPDEHIPDLPDRPEARRQKL